MEPSQPTFSGLHVGAFESRRADEMARLIELSGGVAHVSPSVREVAVAGDAGAIDFVRRLIAGEVGAAIFLSGSGFQRLLSAAENHVGRRPYLAALRATVTVARGLKVAKAMGDASIRPTHTVAKPYTWREVLDTIDRQVPVEGRVVAVQEYGQPNPGLVVGLEARGARVLRVAIYRWELPDDTRPLEGNVRRLARGDLDVVLFTSAVQLMHVLLVARQHDLERPVRDMLQRCVVGSIGPMMSDALRGESLPVDVEAGDSKIAQLVRLAACHAADLRSRKRRVAAVLAQPPAGAVDVHAPWYDSPFMRACRCEPTAVTPVWLMRQAGRYMADYREVRRRVGFLELCKDPSLCSEVMCTAVKRLGVDAAIVFSDMLPILEPMGLDLEFAPSGGPIIHNPVRESIDVDRVLELENLGSLHFVMEAVRLTRGDLPPHLPLIGFAGAPFTLASYAIEGGSSRAYLHTKTLMYRDEGAWRALMERFSRAVVRYLNAQIAAGAQAVQIFDSWVGCLGVEDYRHFVLPHVKQVIAGLEPDVPVIHFATGNPALNRLLGEAGGCVVGVDWRMRLDDAWQAVGTQRAIQGNLEPTVLLADRPYLRRRVRELLDMAAGRPGHIFNLGHGVLPQTPEDNAVALVDAVHEFSQKQAH